jgi:hypothetical protein
MKAWLLCLLLFPVTVGAQPAHDEVVITQLNSHLLALKVLPPLPDGKSLSNVYLMDRQQRAAIRKTLDSQNSDQQKAMRSYADAVGKLYQKPVIPWDLAFALTSVLAGRDLSNDSLPPLK